MGRINWGGGSKKLFIIWIVKIRMAIETKKNRSGNFKFFLELQWPKDVITHMQNYNNIFYSFYQFGTFVQKNPIKTEIGHFSYYINVNCVNPREGSIKVRISTE